MDETLELFLQMCCFRRCLQTRVERRPLYTLFFIFLFSILCRFFAQALSAVVVDELHLIGDGQRGFLLELMLTKLRMMCPAKVQVRKGGPIIKQ